VAIVSTETEQSRLALASATGPGYAMGSIALIVLVITQIVPGAKAYWTRLLFGEEASGIGLIMTLVVFPMLLWGILKAYRELTANDELLVEPNTLTLIQRSWPWMRTRQFRIADIDHVVWQSEKVNREDDSDPRLKQLLRFSGLRGYMAFSHKGRMIRLVTDPSVELSEQVFKVFRSLGISQK
jgi:hypothetical protein